jgi:hypothetical protein
MRHLIAEYLKDMELAWSPATLRSERYRLAAVADLLDGDARKLWDSIQGQKPYSRVTTWTRVTAFYQWCLDNGRIQRSNPYAQFRAKNGRLFKNQYQRHVPDVVWADALRRIDSIPDSAVREKANELVRTGMRYTESFSLENGSVTGKGGKVRAVFLPDGSRSTSYRGSYATFWRKLARAGLKPHDLRKLYLNRAVELGANPFELMALAGWSHLNTAQSYVEANKTALGKLARRIGAKESK